MFTEVQVSNSRSHLVYLQTIISKLSSIAGISRRDTEDIQKAVCEVCSTALRNAAETGDSRLCVRLSTGPDGVVADVIDKYSCCESRSHIWFDEHGYSRGLEGVAHLVDALELTRGSDEITIHLAKHAVRSDSHVNPVCHLAAVGSSLQT